jgi:hypothetical protein
LNKNLELLSFDLDTIEQKSFDKDVGKLGGGNAIPAADLKALDKDAVRDRYIDPDFVPSLILDEIGPILR